MKIQVLVAAMNHNDHSLVEKMNISTDAIIGNQCDYNSVECFEHNGNRIQYLNFNERGVGLNRNNALMRADGDILVFADDDEVFVDNYKELIENAYKEIPNADAIIFNITTIGDDCGRRNVEHISRINIFNALNYGAARLTVKNVAIKSNNITFYRQFGGGTPYSCGEDTLFITDMLKKNMRVYVYPAVIASVNQTTSTWFKGFNEKYFYDKGALFSAMFKKFGYILCCLVFLKNRKLLFDGNIIYKKAAKLAKAGAKGFYNGITYEKWAMGDKNV